MASSAVRWGRLLTAALATTPLSCGQPHPAEPPPPPPASPPVASVAPAPPPQPSLTPISFLLETELKMEPERNGRLLKETIRYGRGTFVHLTFEHWSGDPPRCPVKLPGPCHTFSISTSGKSPDEGAWLGGTLDLGAEKLTERNALPAPQDWVDFSSGRDAVFALRKGGHEVDRIDDQGKVTLFARDPSSQRWNQLQVYEIGELSLLARQRDGSSDDAYWEIAELSAPDSNGVRKPGAGTKLPMKPMPEARPNAQGARTATRAGGMAMFGSPLLTRLDARDSWAMIWLEVVPPPFRWPAGKPQKIEGKKGAKNGCGGPPSRGLDDRSVQKRAHVTRFSKASLIEDTISWSTSELDPYGYQLKFQKEGDKITIEPPPRTNKPIPPSTGRVRRIYGDYEELAFSPAERPEYATFDHDADEGFAFLRSGDQAYLRRFSADGSWLKPAEAIKQDPPFRIKAAASVKGRWYALSDNNASLFDLSGTASPIEIKLSHEYLLDIYQREDKLRLLSLHEGVLWESTLEGNTLGTPPVRLGDLPSGMRPYQLEILHRKGAPPLLAGLTDPRGNEDLRVAWRALVPDAPWTKLDPYPDGAGNYYHARFHPLRGDLAVVYREDKKRFITWLGAGKTSAAEEVNSEPRNGVLGALLSEQDSPEVRLIPEAPGPLERAPELDGIEDICNFAIPTRPDTTVFFCAQPVDPQKPGFRAGLRAYKRPAP